MNAETYPLEAEQPISVWCHIHETWDHDWHYVKYAGNGQHYARGFDMITCIVGSEDIYELAGEYE